MSKLHRGSRVGSGFDTTVIASTFHAADLVSWNVCFCREKSTLASVCCFEREDIIGSCQICAYRVAADARW